MGTDIRIEFFEEFKKKMDKEGYKATVSFSQPTNGETIKLNGVVLYKVIRISNRWGKKGVVVHKNLTETGIKAIGGARATGKNQWVGCPLTDMNYKILMEVLVDVVRKSNISRGIKMEEVSKIISKPKKKMIKKNMYLTNFVIMESEDN